MFNFGGVVKWAHFQKKYELTKKDETPLCFQSDLSFNQTLLPVQFNVKYDKKSN